MTYEWEITRLEKKKENGVVKSAVIGVTCTNTTTGSSGYLDWSVDIEDIPSSGSKPTKAELKTYIKDYLSKDVSEEGEEAYTMASQLKAQADRVIVTYEYDDTIPENEKTITGL